MYGEKVTKKPLFGGRKQDNDKEMGFIKPNKVCIQHTTK